MAPGGADAAGGPDGRAAADGDALERYGCAAADFDDARVIGGLRDGNRPGVRFDGHAAVDHEAGEQGNGSDTGGERNDIARFGLGDRLAQIETAERQVHLTCNENICHF